MKTREELNALNEEVEALRRKLAELNADELAEVTGGMIPYLEDVSGTETEEQWSV